MPFFNLLFLLTNLPKKVSDILNVKAHLEQSNQNTKRTKLKS